MNNSYPCTKLFADTVFEYLEKSIQNSTTKNFSDEDLLTLHSVYGSVFQRALDVLEKHPFVETYSTAKRGRVLIEIKGENDRCYRIFPRMNYCPCRAFRHQVIEKRCQITCKHVLVGRIASISDFSRMSATSPTYLPNFMILGQQEVSYKVSVFPFEVRDPKKTCKTVDREVTQEQYLMLVQSMFDIE